MAPIIDAHIYLYPPSVFNEPRAWAKKWGEPHWADCVDPEGKKSLQGWADIDQLLRDMDSAGIDKVVLLGWYWQNEETCEEQNRWYSEWIKKYPDRLIGFANVHPAAGKQALDEIRKCVEQGLVGLGEFHPQAQGFDLRDPDWLKVVELSIELKLPINIHVTEPVGHAYTGRVETPLADYTWLAKKYPDAKFILAHWGGLLPFYELNPRIREVMKNVYYDCAASALLYDLSIYRAVVDIVGPEKVVWATDYPLLIYPNKDRHPSFQRALDEIRTSGLRDEELELILGGNILRLLNDNV